MGLNVFTGEVMDMKDAGVIEPKRVKKQAIQSASEAAEMILRIDDVIASSGSASEAAEMILRIDDVIASSGSDAPDGMDPSAMGGMPPMM